MNKALLMSIGEPRGQLLQNTQRANLIKAPLLLQHISKGTIHHIGRYKIRATGVLTIFIDRQDVRMIQGCNSSSLFAKTRNETITRFGRKSLRNEIERQGTGVIGAL